MMEKVPGKLYELAADLILGSSTGSHQRFDCGAVLMLIDIRKPPNKAFTTYRFLDLDGKIRELDDPHKPHFGTGDCYLIRFFREIET